MSLESLVFSPKEAGQTTGREMTQLIRENQSEVKKDTELTIEHATSQAKEEPDAGLKIALLKNPELVGSPRGEPARDKFIDGYDFLYVARREAKLTSLSTITLPSKAS